MPGGGGRCRWRTEGVWPWSTCDGLGRVYLAGGREVGWRRGVATQTPPALGPRVRAGILGVWGAAGGGAPCQPQACFLSAQDRSLTGKLEPVSPPSPPHTDPELELAPPRLSKEELIQNMDRVDREITVVEQQISKLKKKQVRALSSRPAQGQPRVAAGRGGLRAPSCPFLLPPCLALLVRAAARPLSTGRLLAPPWTRPLGASACSSVRWVQTGCHLMGCEGGPGHVVKNESSL